MHEAEHSFLHLKSLRFAWISQVMAKWREWHLTPPLHGEIQASLRFTHVCMEKTQVSRTAAVAFSQSSGVD